MPAIADITKVVAPVDAVSGETVIVDVHVKNLGLAPGGYNYISVGGLFDSNLLNWQFPTDPPSQFSDYLYVAPQATDVFKGWFTMPLNSVKVTTRAYYWDGSKWIFDDTASVSISLIQPTPEPAHLFSDLEVIYSRV